MDLKADRVRLNQLLGTIGEQFQIPPYQRPYAWESDQIDDLWDDLTSTLDEGHFLGTIVLNTEDEGRPQVIDGQQRLTTLLMILGLMRDEYHRAGRSNSAGGVHQFLIADQFATGSDTFKLRTGNANWKPFRDLVLRYPDDEHRMNPESFSQLPKDVRARSQALLDNWKRLAQRLADWLGEKAGNDRIERLAALERSVIAKLQLVAIRVGNVSDAFLLFETLNDRGLQLSAADLLKNHLLARVAESDPSEAAVREAAAEWDSLLDDLGSGVDVTRFLRHYLLMRFPKVRKDDVYDRFKEEVAHTGPHSLIDELRAFGKLYGEFENPGLAREPSVVAALEDLKTLRAVSCYTALMPARRYLSSEDFVRFARLAEVLTFRYSTVGSMDSKELERAYHKAAKRLADSKGAQLREARDELVSMLPSSEFFVQAFMQQRMGRHYLVRYTLGRIEQHLSRDSEKVLKGNSKVHIEHIMPQTLNEEWRRVLGDRVEEHGDFVNRWGNLTLLLFKLNIAASNSPFMRKRVEYKNSRVHLTQRLCQYEVWDLDSIVGRQEWLARIADEVWAIEQPAANEGHPTEPDGQHSGGGPAELLEGEERRLFEGLAVETSASEAAVLNQKLAQHMAVLEHESNQGKRVDMELARKICARLKQLTAMAPELNAIERSWLRGAVDYFVLSADASADSETGGLADDVRVVNAVVRHLELDIEITLPDSVDA